MGQGPRLDCGPWARRSCVEVTGQRGERPHPAGQEADGELQKAPEYSVVMSQFSKRNTFLRTLILITVDDEFP